MSKLAKGNFCNPTLSKHIVLLFLERGRNLLKENVGKLIKGKCEKLQPYKIDENEFTSVQILQVPVLYSMLLYHLRTSTWRLLEGSFCSIEVIKSFFACSKKCLQIEVNLCGEALGI